MSDGPLIIVKFRNMAPQSERCEKLLTLVGNDLEVAEPLFPGEEEPELGSLFQVKLRDRSNVPDVLGQLSVEQDVEYAHEPAERRPKSL